MRSAPVAGKECDVVNQSREGRQALRRVQPMSTMKGRIEQPKHRSHDSVDHLKQRDGMTSFDVSIPDIEDSTGVVPKHVQ